MKKLFRNLMLVAVAALGMASCADVPPPFIEPGGEVTAPGTSGTWDAPFTVAELVANQSDEVVWVHGYIVGSIPEGVESSTMKYMTFTADDASGTNICIADSPDETDYSKCVPVQLPSGSDARSMLNLKNNSGKLGVEVWLKGTASNYCGSAGLKSVVTFTLVAPTEEDDKKGEFTPADGAIGDGSLENPFNAAAAYNYTGVLPAGQATTEKFYVRGIVCESSKFEVSPQYKNATFHISEDGTATGTQFLIYRTKGLNGADITSESDVQVGDEVIVYASLVNYNGTTPETAQGGIIYSQKRGGVDVTPGEGGEEENPDTPDASSGNGTWDAPYSVAGLIANQTNSEVWVRGYIVGSIPGSRHTEMTFTATNASGTNICIAASPTETDYTKCVPVQLPNGSDARTYLNLKNNPGMLGKEVWLKGSAEKYCGAPGLKGVSKYTLSAPTSEDGGTAGEDDTPADGGNKYTMVTAMSEGTYVIAACTSGTSYVIAKSLDASYNYGYLYTDNATLNGNALTATETNEFVFKAVDGGYTIQDVSGRYYYMSGDFNSFNVSPTPKDGYVWSVIINADGTFSLTNVEKGKTIQYSSEYSSYGAYSDITNTLPCLFKK